MALVAFAHPAGGLFHFTMLSILHVEKSLGAGGFGTVMGVRRKDWDSFRTGPFCGFISPSYSPCQPLSQAVVSSEPTFPKVSLRLRGKVYTWGTTRADFNISADNVFAFFSGYCAIDLTAFPTSAPWKAPARVLMIAF